MTKNEARERLCKLMASVNTELTQWNSAADCICADGDSGPAGDYRNEGEAIAFIEAAVNAALAARKLGR